MAFLARTAARSARATRAMSSSPAGIETSEQFAARISEASAATASWRGYSVAFAGLVGFAAVFQYFTVEPKFWRGDYEYMRMRHAGKGYPWGMNGLLDNPHAFANISNNPEDRFKKAH